MQRIKRLIDSGVPFSFNGHKVTTTTRNRAKANASMIGRRRVTASYKTAKESLYEWFYDDANVMSNESYAIANAASEQRKIINKIDSLCGKADKKMERAAKKYGFTIEDVSLSLTDNSNGSEVYLEYRLNHDLYGSELREMSEQMRDDDFTFDSDEMNTIWVSFNFLRNKDAFPFIHEVMKLANKFKDDYGGS